MSSSSATVGVDKATSDLLIGPDWTMNIDICDSINNHRWQAKDVIKALKKRLQHKNPKVQLLALTLLETMVKNCGDIVHFQIADRNILQEMIKIVRKKMDMHVRDKILVLLDSWQEAFGGAGGKYPQYYWAYEELRRSGVQFPERSRDAAPIHTPPAAPSAPRQSQAGYGMPSDTSRRLDEAMASESENLSMANLYSMRSVQELLSDMLQAVNPTDREAIKDEVIVDLVSQCRSHQKKLMQMLTSTGDEQLLGQGLELNDSLQSVLAKHDAIASGSPLPAETTYNNSPSGSPLPAEVTYNNNSASPVPTEVRDASPRSNPAATSIASATSSQLEEEDDEDDDFAQLARRRTKASAMSSEISVQSDGAVPAPSTSSPSNALVLTTPPPAVRTSATKEQDIIDLLSITLSTTSVSPHAPQSNTNQTMNQVPYSTTAEGNPYGSQVYAENQGQATYSNYVAPWAQPQPQQQQWVAPQPQPWAGQQSQPRPQQWVAQQSQPQAQQWATQQSQQQTQQWAAQQAQPQPQQAQPWVQHQAQPPQAPAQPQPWAEQQAPQHPQQQQPQAQAQPQAQPPQAPAQPQQWAEQQAPQQPQPQQQQQPQAQAQHQAQPQPQPWAEHQAQPQQPQSQQQSWAPPASQPQPQPWVQQQAQTQPWAQPQSQQWGQQQAQGQSQAWAQRQQQSQPQAQAPQQSFNYPPPPWATTTTTQAAKSLQSHNSFPARGSNGSAISEGHKPFIPSYRLFEDLNVLGSADAASTNSPRMSGQSMLGGRK